MRLKRLRASNAKQYFSVDIDLSKVHLASIIGYYTFNKAKSNGAGKSTLGDLIMYALFESVPDKSLTVSDLVGWGAHKMTVELEFEYENNTYLVKREHTPNSKAKNAMELEINGVQQGKDILERRQILAKSLGIDDQIAQATWFFQQSGSNKLTAADPKDRKDYLAAVLDADKYEKAYLYAKERAGEIERDIDGIRKAAAQLADANAKLVEAEEGCKHSEAAKQREYQTVASINEKLTGLRAKLSSLEGQRTNAESEGELTNALQKANDDIAKAERSLSDVESQLTGQRAESEEAKRSLGLLDAEKQKADRICADIISKWKALHYSENFAVEVNKYVWEYKLKTGNTQTRLKELEAEMASISGLGGNCPTCGQIIDATCKQKLFADAQAKHAEMTAQLSADNDQLTKMHQNEIFAGDDDKTLRNAQSIVQGYESARSSLQSAINNAASIEATANQQLGMMRAQIQSIKTAKQDLENRLVRAKQAAGLDSGPLQAEILAVTESLNVAQKQAEQAAVTAGKWQAHRESLVQHKHGLEQVVSKLAGLEDELRVRQTVVQLFHRDGLPLSKINSACSLIEAYANSMMSSVLPNYHLKVVVESGKRGTLDFMVNTPGGLQPYAVLSGGEKAVAGLCLRMALSRILAEGSGHRFETLFLDEVFGPLDQVYRPIMMSLVKELSKSFKAIFVISHEVEIQTAFPQVVLVECDGIRSRVNVLENNEVE